jgi:hypothetical protein
MQLARIVINCWVTFAAAAGAAAAPWYPLPADGSTVTFAISDEVSDLHPVPPGTKAHLPTNLSIKTTLMLRSVGQAVWNGQPCRWIEIKLVKRPGDLDPTGRILILKLLVPEQRFAAGDYPLRHVTKAYRLDSSWTETIDTTLANRIDEDAALLQYELDRFLPALPAPPKDAKWTMNQSVETPLGKIDATRADFVANYEGKLSGGKSGKWTWQAQYQVWLSPACPFGMARLDFESTNTELDDYGKGISMKLRRKMILQNSGTGAVSDLPNCE